MVKTGWFSSQGKYAPADAIATNGSEIAKGLEEVAKVAVTTTEIDSVRQLTEDKSELKRRRK